MRPLFIFMLSASPALAQVGQLSDLGSFDPLVGLAALSATLVALLWEVRVQARKTENAEDTE